MKTANTKNAGAKKNANKNKGGNAGKAGKATATVQTLGRVIGETLAGDTKDGALNVEVKRHDLSKGEESVAAMIKRLLMTEGESKTSISAAMRKRDAKYNDDKLCASTLNTIRADLKRTLGGLVVATGWRTDNKQGMLATAAVAKLRTHTLGVSAYSVELKRAEVKSETAADTAKK